MSRQDGGAAFPMRGTQHDEDANERDPGMSLWDYFAAKALQGIAANPHHSAVDFNPQWEGYEGGIPEEYEQAAREAGLMADALLAERAKREEAAKHDDNQ